MVSLFFANTTLRKSEKKRHSTTKNKKAEFVLWMGPLLDALRGTRGLFTNFQQKNAPDKLVISPLFVRMSLEFNGQR